MTGWGRPVLALNAVGEGLASVSSRTVTWNGSECFAVGREQEVSSESCSRQDFVIGFVSRARVPAL